VILKEKKQSRVVHALGLKTNSDTIYILNELFDIEKNAIEELCAYIFEKNPECSKIRFTRIPLSASDLSLPANDWLVSEDYVLRLPEDPEVYFSKLGCATRKHLKYYDRKLLEHDSQAKFYLVKGSDIERDVVEKVIILNHRRMKTKGKTSGLRGEYAKKVSALAFRYGFIGVFESAGEIIAGALSFQVGRHFYLETIAHDDCYNRFNLGQLCLLKTIQRAISEGATHFHFLWGDCEYKTRFLAKKVPFFGVDVYRVGWRRGFSRHAWVSEKCLKKIKTFLRKSISRK
jgi:CelD/BcsL family acetyltransferase involved in cellulose biosynthesis